VKLKHKHQFSITRNENWLYRDYFLSVVVVEVDSCVLDVTGSPAGVGSVTLLVVVVDVVDSFSLLQPASKAKLAKLINSILLVFMELPRILGG
jgi:hypothetical protein